MPKVILLYPGKILHIMYINHTRLKIKAVLVLALLVCLFSACKHRPDHDSNDTGFKPGLRLSPGAVYYYNVSAEMTNEIELEGRTIENINKSTIGLLYEVVKDTAAGWLLKITYDSIHIVTKKGDVETEVDAANASLSFDPVEKMLGGLKGNAIWVAIQNNGQVVSVRGYKEITDKLMSAVDVTSLTEAEIQKMHERLNSMLGEGFIKNNLEQGVNLFPDSVLHEGDHWTKNNNVSNELNLSAEAAFTLSAIKNNIAEIESATRFNNQNNNSTVIMGFKSLGNLEGSEKGLIQTDITTGMPVMAKSDAAIHCSILIMGREVPVNINLKKELSVKRIK